MTTTYGYVDTPVGRLLVVAEGGRVIRIDFERAGGPVPPEPGQVGDDAAVRAVREQLGEYFAGRRRVFDLDLELRGTPFQCQVWQALREIPFGCTISYGELARRVGRPGAARAVGAANGRNPIPIVVPCHRVIGGDGTLTGFGGGLDAKRALLDHERYGGGLFAAADE